MSSKIVELKADLAELEVLQNQATRQKVKDMLSIEARKITTEIVRLQEESPASTNGTLNTPQSHGSGDQRYQVKLNNYAWDQSNQFVKFYVTLKGVQQLPQDNVYCIFTEKSLEMHVKNLDNKDYFFTITNLLNKINPEKSSWKVKTDMVFISVAKLENVSWTHVTELEKKVKDSKKLVPDKDDKSDDPNEGLMQLMKKMYQEGDDEMKRNIAKAWTESQTKINHTG